MRSIALIVLLALAGCGSAPRPDAPRDPEAQVRAAMHGIWEATMARDSARVCASYTPAAIRRLESQLNGQTCAEAFAQPFKEAPRLLLAASEPHIVWIVVNGDHATVGPMPDNHLADPSPRAHFVREHGRWLRTYDFTSRDTSDYAECMGAGYGKLDAVRSWRPVADEVKVEYLKRLCDRLDALGLWQHKTQEQLAALSQETIAQLTAEHRIAPEQAGTLGTPAI